MENPRLRAPTSIVSLLREEEVLKNVMKEIDFETKAAKINPFSGKEIGVLTVGAAIGLEGALFGPFHILKALGATTISCAGISLLDLEIKNLYSFFWSIFFSLFYKKKK